MKIVSLSIFLSLPPGTLFSKYSPCAFDELLIKGDSCSGAPDFFYQSIASAVDCNGSSDLMDVLDKAERDGTSVSMDFDCQGRDGMFEQGQLFAVWESADVEAFMTRLQTAFRAAYPPPT